MTPPKSTSSKGSRDAKNVLAVAATEEFVGVPVALRASQPDSQTRRSAGRREVSEWIGKTPDSKVPAHVRLRIFNRHGGRCWIAKRKIAAGEPWDLDHMKALCNGGEHRESNLAPALRDKHREKTAADVRERADTDRKRKKHFGICQPKSRGFDKRLRKRMDGTVVPREARR